MAQDAIGTHCANRLRCLRVERGKRSMGVSLLCEMAAALDAPISLFFDGLAGTAPNDAGPSFERSKSELLDLLGRIRDPELLSLLNCLVRHLAMNKK
ncbi:MAG: hypothetical protein EXQ88_06045 [Alphaproteobacteria bacterium]|nr:hypothetical protein [Alphaproteobacteria bacterium]